MHHRARQVIDRNAIPDVVVTIGVIFQGVEALFIQRRVKERVVIPVHLFNEPVIFCIEDEPHIGFIPCKRRVKGNPQFCTFTA